MTDTSTRLYETTFIVRPDMDSTMVDGLRDQVSDLLSTHKAPQVRWESWGKRKLAFPIKKSSKGIYLYVLYLGEPEAAAEVERVLKLNENVLRSMTVRVLESVDAGSFDFQLWSAKMNPLARTGEEDEEMDSDNDGGEAASADSDTTDDEASGDAADSAGDAAEESEAAAPEDDEEDSE